MKTVPVAAVAIALAVAVACSASSESSHELLGSDRLAVSGEIEADNALTGHSPFIQYAVTEWNMDLRCLNGRLHQ